MGHPNQIRETLASRCALARDDGGRQTQIPFGDDKQKATTHPSRKSAR